MRRSSLQDVNFRGAVVKSGVRLWSVGVDAAKDLLFGRLKVAEHGPGYVHFAAGLPPEFFLQLTAEARKLQRTAHGETYRWVKTRLRNEALDATVYALFAAHAIGLHKYTAAQWDRLEAKIVPATGSAPAAVDQPVPPKVAPVRRPFVQRWDKPRRGWVTGWQR